MDSRFTELGEIYASFDRIFATALRKGGRAPSCGAGCFACCYEAVYCDRLEAEHILSTLTAEQKEALKPALREWMDRFFASGLDRQEMPKIWDYLPLRLRCPLLGPDGLCTVYADRPFSCRVHTAVGPRELCHDQAKRPQQRFAEARQLTCAAALEIGRVTNHAVLDHLCIHLANLLLGDTRQTKARTEYVIT